MLDMEISLSSFVATSETTVNVDNICGTTPGRRQCKTEKKNGGNMCNLLGIAIPTFYQKLYPDHKTGKVRRDWRE